MKTMRQVNISKYSVAICCLLITFCSCFKEDINYAEGTLNPEASLYVVRNAFKGEQITLTKEQLAGAHITAGVVISENANKNFPSGYIAIENVWREQVRGILVAVPNTEQFSFGDSVRIDVEGATLARDNGVLVIKNIGADKITVVPGVKVEKRHRPVSIGTIEANPDQYESTLVSVTADLSPDPTPGETFRGAKKVLDGEKKELELFTEDGAVFANEKIAPSASFQGVLLKRGDRLSLRMQSVADMMYPSGKLYTGWPETFEDPYQVKTSYNMTAINNLVTMPTGTWYMLQCIQGITAGRDRIVSGKQAVRFQQNLSSSALLQMNFDVPDGASKVTVWYGSYYTDRSCTFVLEYSTDQGASWTAVGDTIRDAHSTAESLIAKQAVFLMDIQQPVRFRINKLGLGTSNNTVSNGRLGLDDFAIYKSY